MGATRRDSIHGMTTRSAEMLRERYLSAETYIYLVRLDRLAQVLHCLMTPTHLKILGMS
jgi:hypothetical protein